ncbi:MAG: hypothetical protein RLY93_17965 [Sumerlaeia bacterium]
MKLERRDALFFVLGSLALLALFLLLRHEAIQAGAFFTTQDETFRVHCARLFAENGDYSSYDYTWLPLPIIVGGFLGDALGGHYYQATLLINTVLVALALLAGLGAAWVAARPHFHGRRPAVAWAGVGMGGLMALTLPWVVWASVQGFAEPFLWFGLMMGHLGAAIVCGRGAHSRRLAAGFLVAGGGVAIAACSRYEAWLYAAALGPAGALILWVQWKNASRDSERRPIRWEVPALLLAWAAALAPVFWWMSVHWVVHGDPFYTFVGEHRVIPGPTGEAQDLRTAMELWGDSQRWLACLGILVGIVLMTPKWSLPYAALTVPPLVHLLAVLVSIGRGGIPWIFPERVFSFHALALAFPAGLALAQMAAGRAGAESWRKTRRKLWPRIALASGLFLLIAGLGVGRTMLPPIGAYESQRVTRERVERALRHRPLQPGEFIAVPGHKGLVLYDGLALAAPDPEKVIAAPLEWRYPLPHSAASQMQPWLRERNVAVLVLAWRLPEGDRKVLAEKTYDYAPAGERLEALRHSGDAFAVVTSGKVDFLPPEDLIGLIRERGLQGPSFQHARADWIRYTALVSDEDGTGSGTEVLHIDPTQVTNFAHQFIPPRPRERRNGWPGDWVAMFEPTPYEYTLVRIGDSSLKIGTRPGWHVIAFDAQSGTVHDRFWFDGDPRFAREHGAEPYLVYLLKK